MKATLKIRSLAAAVLLVGVLLGACANQAASYESAGDLAAALARADVSCDSPETRPAGQLVGSQAACTGGGSRLELYVFDDEQQRDTWLLVGAQLGPVAIGPNWTITGDAEATQQAATALNARFDDQG